MMTIASRTAAAIAFASLLLLSSAYAQTTTAPAAAPAATEEKAEKPRTAASLECSKEADAKGLHGKERKKFRADCEKGSGLQGKVILLTLPWRGRDERSSLSGSTQMIRAARSGDSLSSRTVPEWRDHPIPSHISRSLSSVARSREPLAQCEPTIPLQGRVKHQ